MNEEYTEIQSDMKNWVGDEDAYKNMLLLVLKNIDVSLRKIANYYDHK